MEHKKSIEQRGARSNQNERTLQKKLFNSRLNGS